MARPAGPRWFKFDAFFFANRKVLRAGRNGRDVFAAVLCMNAQRDSLGFVPIADWEPEYLAHFLGVSADDAAEGMSRAVTAGLVTVGVEHVSIVGWDEHWGSRGQSRAEIQKAYRERKKGNAVNGDSVTVTPLQQNHALPIERDREIEREKKVTLSLSWAPSPELDLLAQQLGCDLAHEVAQFRAHYRANGHRYVDWNAVFEKFLRGSRDKGKAPEKPKPGATTSKRRRRKTVVNGEHFVENDDGDLELDNAAHSSNGAKP